jgi:hypothetical protein
MVRYLVMGLPPGSSGLGMLQRFRSWGFTRRPRAAVRTEPLPTAVSDALCLEQIVPVVVLDLLWEVSRSAQVTARRPVRTEPLPTAVSVALCLEQIVLVVVLVLVLAYDLCGRLPRN